MVQTKRRTTHKMFKLHETLERDCLMIGEFDLSLVLLSRDANYPWLILVPKRQGIREIHQLNNVDRQQLLMESCQLSEVITALFDPDKLNIATLGNLVPQLHMHHVARYRSDCAWPGPIWGASAPKSYHPQLLRERCESLRQQLQNCGLRYSAD